MPATAKREVEEVKRIEPAIVRPRVFTADSGEPLLLSDVVADHLRHGDPRPICVVGTTGAGKSTALAHLAAELPAALTLLDEPTASELDDASRPTPKAAPTDSTRSTNV